MELGKKYKGAYLHVPVFFLLEINGAKLIFYLYFLEEKDQIAKILCYEIYN